MSRRLLRAVLTGAVLLGTAGTAMGASITRTSGKVTATLNYTTNGAPYGGYATTSTLDLVVRTRGRAVNRITMRGLGFRSPGSVIQVKNALTVRDVTGDGDPEVLVRTLSGGAHCCFEIRVVRWVPKAGRYVVNSHGFGASSPTIQNLNRDRLVEFVGHDDRLAYRLDASFADSTFPPRVWNFRNGRFVDVSRQFPAVGVRGMNASWAAYQRLRKRQPTARGNALAGYLASAAIAGPAQRRAALKRVQTAERANPSLVANVVWEVRRLGYPVG